MHKRHSRVPGNNEMHGVTPVLPNSAMDDVRSVPATTSSGVARNCLNRESLDLRRRDSDATEEWFGKVALPPSQNFLFFLVTDFGEI